MLTSGRLKFEQLWERLLSQSSRQLQSKVFTKKFLACVLGFIAENYFCAPSKHNFQSTSVCERKLWSQLKSRSELRGTLVCHERLICDMHVVECDNVGLKKSERIKTRANMIRFLSRSTLSYVCYLRMMI